MAGGKNKATTKKAPPLTKCNYFLTAHKSYFYVFIIFIIHYQIAITCDCDTMKMVVKFSGTRAISIGYRSIIIGVKWIGVNDILSTERKLNLSLKRMCRRVDLSFCMPQLIK